MQADKEILKHTLQRKKQHRTQEYMRREVLQDEYEERLRECDRVIERLDSEIDDLEEEFQRMQDPFAGKMVSDDFEASRHRAKAGALSRSPDGSRLGIPIPPPGFEGRPEHEVSERSSVYSQDSQEAMQRKRQQLSPKTLTRSPAKAKATSRAPVPLYVPGARRRVHNGEPSPGAKPEIPQSEDASSNEHMGRAPPPGFPIPRQGEKSARPHASPAAANGQHGRADRDRVGHAAESHAVDTRRGSWDLLVREEEERAQGEHRSFGAPQTDRVAQKIGPTRASDGDVAAMRREINAEMDRMLPHDDGTDGGGSSGGGEDKGGKPPAAGPPVKKVREWDVNKHVDPQKELWERERMKGGERLNWGDEPLSPLGGEEPSTRDSENMGRGMMRGGCSQELTGHLAEDFPGLFPPDRDSPEQMAWMVDREKQLAEFPSLRGAAPAPSNNPWAAKNIREHLTDGRPFAGQGGEQNPERSSMPVEEYERQAGLRHPGDDQPDAGLRRKVTSKKDFQFWERVRGQSVNVVEGLELHQSVLTPVEQLMLEQAITGWVAQGLKRQLRGRTFSAPRKWIRGKGRITVQFGCCYNYAPDSQGRDKGIIAEEVVEPMPPILTALVKRLVRWGVLPRAQEPDSAIVNVYEAEDCIPPHIDHHDFSRPFCTISLLSQEDIMFGSRLVPEGPGLFRGANGQQTLISLPVGSCLVLKGNGADVAMHCVPPVRARRMSITLRKMGTSHAAAVREAARGVNEGREALPPARMQVELADLVTTRSREAASRDAQREGRWTEESHDRWSAERW